MPKFVIEREVPEVGKMTPEQLHGLSSKSCSVLAGMPDVHWIHSYVTGDKIYCVYVAPDEASVREHARRGASRPTASQKCGR